MHLDEMEMHSELDTDELDTDDLDTDGLDTDGLDTDELDTGWGLIQKKIHGQSRYHKTRKIVGTSTQGELCKGTLVAQDAIVDGVGIKRAFETSFALKPGGLN